MKKFFAIASTILLFFVISCNTAGTGSTSNSQGEKNIATNKAINDAISSGDVSKLDQYIATDGVDHSGDNGEVKGLDSIKANLKRFHDEYKDMKFEVKQAASNGDYVFALTRFTGTNVVASMGAPAGTSFDMTSIDVTKYNSDGKATDHWIYMEPSDVMKMMGGNKMEVGPGTGGKMDTTMKK